MDFICKSIVVRLFSCEFYHVDGYLGRLWGEFAVASFADAWIEISARPEGSMEVHVASFADAWIKIRGAAVVHANGLIAIIRSMDCYFRKAPKAGAFFYPHFMRNLSTLGGMWRGMTKE